MSDSSLVSGPTCPDDLDVFSVPPDQLTHPATSDIVT
jgi:hypothetical protein